MNPELVALIEQLRHACAVALGDLLVLGMPVGASTDRQTASGRHRRGREASRGGDVVKFRVTIDGGGETTLTYDRHSESRGHRYLTPGNAASHAFAQPLVVGQAFRTNGHRYEILEAL